MYRFIVKDIDSRTSFRTINRRIQCYIYRHIFTTCTTVSILQVIHALYLFFTKQKGCQVFDSYVCSSSCALLAITELPNNELSGIHTQPATPSLVTLNEHPIILPAN